MKALDIKIISHLDILTSKPFTKIESSEKKLKTLTLTEKHFCLTVTASELAKDSTAIEYLSVWFAGCFLQMTRNNHLQIVGKFEISHFYFHPNVFFYALSEKRMTAKIFTGLRSKKIFKNKIFTGNPDFIIEPRHYPFFKCAKIIEPTLVFYQPFNP